MTPRDPNTNFPTLRTEQVNPDSTALDTLSTLDCVRLMNQIDREVPARVGDAAESIAQAIDLVVAHFRKGGRLVYVGAGTSGRLGIMDAAECPPTFGVDRDRVACVMAGGRAAVFQAREQVEDDPHQAARDLEAFGLTPADVVLALASSGRTPYGIGALNHAARIGAGRIALSCNKPALLSRHAKVAIEVDTGPEIVMGSTRLKAGTAQKLVLNMISTLSMVQLGHVYRNLMVNVRGDNVKLGHRMLRIFAEATGNPEPETARKKLAAAGGALKTAIVMECAGVDPAQAEAVLQRHGRNVRDALHALNHQPRTTP